MSHERDVIVQTRKKRVSTRHTRGITSYHKGRPVLLSITYQLGTSCTNDIKIFSRSGRVVLFAEGGLLVFSLLFNFLQGNTQGNAHSLIVGGHTQELPDSRYSSPVILIKTDSFGWLSLFLHTSMIPHTTVIPQDRQWMYYGLLAISIPTWYYICAIKKNAGELQRRSLALLSVFEAVSRTSQVVLLYCTSSGQERQYSKVEGEA